MKIIFTIKIEVRTPAINQKMHVSLDHGVSLHFISSYFEYFWVTFHTKNRVKHHCQHCTLTEAIKHVATTNRYLRCSGERNGAQRRTKVSIGRTMHDASIGAAAVCEKVHLQMK